MASQWRDSSDARLTGSDNLLPRIPQNQLQDSPERERCELILWIESNWRCEYWVCGESGAMRLFNRGNPILDVPVTDPIAALQEARGMTSCFTGGCLTTRERSRGRTATPWITAHAIRLIKQRCRAGVRGQRHARGSPLAH
jgi:hypothetical protein